VRKARPAAVPLGAKPTVEGGPPKSLANDGRAVYWRVPDRVFDQKRLDSDLATHAIAVTEGLSRKERARSPGFDGLTVIDPAGVAA